MSSKELPVTGFVAVRRGTVSVVLCKMMQVFLSSTGSSRLVSDQHGVAPGVLLAVGHGVRECL